MSDLVYNEKTKLLANALDRASTACFAVGGVSPIVAAGFGTNLAGSVLGAVGWLFTATMPHLGARMVLERLRA